VAAAIQGAALMVALVRPLTGRRAIAIGLGAVGVTLAAAIWAWVGGRFQAGLADLIRALLLAMIPVAVLMEFRRTLALNAQSILATLCIYLVIGMFFAALAESVANLGGVAYFSGHSTADSSDYLYFSFVTEATIGYGDFVPALRLGRALAVLEGLSGQIYLVTVVALVVGNLGRQRQRR
jgi:hypothetical protein